MCSSDLFAFTARRKRQRGEGGAGRWDALLGAADADWPAVLAQTEAHSEDWRALERRPNVRVAAALVEIDEDGLADEVLRHQARIGDPAQFQPLSRLARDLGLPAVPDDEKQRRYDRFMAKQQAISASIQKAKIGKRLPAIVDKAENGIFTGRTRADAPEIDGKVMISSRRPLRPGEIVTVKIERADAYDLAGSAV